MCGWGKGECSEQRERITEMVCSCVLGCCARDRWVSDGNFSLKNVRIKVTREINESNRRAYRNLKSDLLIGN